MTTEAVHNTKTPNETLAVAKALAEQQPDCPAYYLEGELGAGKTLFTKGLAAAYGIDTTLVVSPTFALVNRYSGGSRGLYHLDLYRIEKERELDELGIEEMEEEGALVVVEWAEKLGRWRRADATVVHFDVLSESKRRLRVEAQPPSSASVSDETTVS